MEISPGTERTVGTGEHGYRSCVVGVEFGECNLEEVGCHPVHGIATPGSVNGDDGHRAVTANSNGIRHDFSMAEVGRRGQYCRNWGRSDGGSEADGATAGTSGGNT